MTEKDKKFIELAESLSFTEMHIVSRWVEKADTEEGRKRLKEIFAYMYDREQVANGHY